MRGRAGQGSLIEPLPYLEESTSIERENERIKEQFFNEARKRGSFFGCFRWQTYA